MPHCLFCEYRHIGPYSSRQTVFLGLTLQLVQFVQFRQFECVPGVYSILQFDGREAILDVQPAFIGGEVQRLLPIPEIILLGGTGHSAEAVERVQQGDAQEAEALRDAVDDQEPAEFIRDIHTRYHSHHLEIKDSCDFVEISEFGYCIGKTFLQLLKIIKWFLKAWIKDTRKYEKVKASLESQTSEEANFSQQNLCAFCEELIKVTPYGREMKGKRKGVNINDIASEMRDAKMSHRREVSHLMEMKENILERYTQKDIESKKHIGDISELDILNRKHIAMKLQISNNESVLEEVLNEFSIKTQAMTRFVTNTQANCIEDFKMNQESDYVLFEQQMRASITQKYNEAREKLKNLVLQKIVDHDKHKRDRLVHREVQTTAQEYSDRQKNEMRIKQLSAACQKLKNELESEKALSESLKQLLESKSIEFEKEFLNYRKEVITSDIKSRHYLKSLKSFKDGIEPEDDEDEKDEKDDTASIDLQESTREVGNRRKHLGKVVSGSLRDKDRVKHRYSIKFTVEEGSNLQENEDAVNESLRNSHQQNEVSVQTDPICIVDDSSPEPLGNNYFIFNKQKVAAKSLMKEFRSNKTASQKMGKKSHTQLYAHVKSKVVNMIQKEAVKSVRRDFKQTRSSCMGDMVKKLSVDYLFPRQKEVSSAPVLLYPLAQQATFSPVVSFYLVKEDILNLFLSDRNARDYECLIYRNSLFNLANLNQKRMINLSKQIQSSDLQWIAKKESAVSESVQGKIVHAYYHQLLNLRKREKAVYEQIKQLMRSPYEISKKVEVIQLENSETAAKDIEVAELKKMLNIILKFHCDCIGQQKDSICQHIANFSQKIGIKLA